ncbi:alpha/beta hydrolase [Lutibacter sp.]|uniref:alpha/beta hydrolase n=1 Tax=Lutibacter sp. TaxID=1925666 RepID=UPI001A1F487F|nr:alpha/beta hydrolase [Lutibacter sp.]MBI9040679.1 alpha/beta hydrolase [Lutibacter sp.]
MKLKTLIAVLIFFMSNLYAQEKNYISQEVSIPSKNIHLNGTLLNPTSKGKKPLVILIPGSGPTDRNGNNAAMTNNSLKYLAEELAESHIASYRFDKSVLSYTKDDKAKIDSISFNTFIDEAKTVIQYFKNTKKYLKIIVAGHSQGSLVGMIASENKVDAFISLAGAGRSIDEILIEQIGKQAPFLVADTEKVLNELKKGNTVEEFNPLLISIFNKSVQPFLISWIKYNPQEEIKKLTIPILIINGSKDIQVSNLDAELLHKSNPNSRLKIIAEMNHIFKEIKGDTTENMSSYNNPDLPIKQELLTIITTFVNELK